MAVNIFKALYMAVYPETSFQSPIVVSFHHSILTKPIISIPILRGIKYLKLSSFILDTIKVTSYICYIKVLTLRLLLNYIEQVMPYKYRAWLLSYYRY